MEMIAQEARKCRFCGEILDPTLRELEMLKRQQQQNTTPIVVNNNNNNNNSSNNGGGCCGGAVYESSTTVVVEHPNPKSGVAYVLLGLFKLFYVFVCIHSIKNPQMLSGAATLHPANVDNISFLFHFVCL